MLKIFSAAQIPKIDQITINEEPVASHDLMERAASAFCNWFSANISPSGPIYIFCGQGNNGGDGLCIARMLNFRGYVVKAFILNQKPTGSPDFERNKKRLQKYCKFYTVNTAKDVPALSDQVVIIDAIFGSGLHTQVEGLPAEVIRKINESRALTVAVDIPSGLFADQPSAGPIVEADYTVSFQFPKLSFLLPQAAPYVGEWYVVDIGLSKNAISETSTSHYLITAEHLDNLLRQRNRFSHKGNFGHVLVIGGSFGKIGAAMLTAEAACKTGAGLVSLFLPHCAYAIAQVSLPEAMVQVDMHEHIITEVTADLSEKTIAFGPGIGTAEETATAFKDLLEETNRSMVLDADGLNILAKHPEWLKLLPKHSILTPHPGEFKRLVGEWKDDFEKLDKLKGLAKEFEIIVVLKGAFSATATPDGNIYFNNSGNPGMATGGSGDVLTGIIAGLLAQGYVPEEAAISGVYLHGMAGDFAAAENGENYITAKDIIKYLKDAFQFFDL